MMFTLRYMLAGKIIDIGEAIITFGMWVLGGKACAREFINRESRYEG